MIVKQQTQILVDYKINIDVCGDFYNHLQKRKENVTVNYQLPYD